MTAALLPTLQQFCDRRGLDRPTAVMSANDDTIRQLRALSNEVIEDIVSRGHSWQAFQKEATFVSVAQEQQVLVATAAPWGFKHIIPDTFFDRTARLRIFGPRTPAEFQQARAIVNTGPLYTYRMWAKYIWFQPTPPAGHNVYFEYASDYSILAADGVTYRKWFAADDDVFQLDESVFLAGLNWKWRKEKGLSYGKEQQDFEALLAQAIGTDGDKPTLNMETGLATNSVKPGVLVAPGAWPL